MTTVQLRKKVHEIVDTADERLLKMVYAMMNEYSAIDEDWLLKEEEIAYERVKAIKSGKTKAIPVEEAVRKVKTSLKK